MILQPAQQDWLVKLGVKAVVQKKLQAKEDMKAAMLVKLLRDQQDHDDDLREGTQQTVIKEGTKTTQKTQDYEERDQSKLFDLDEQKQGFVLAKVTKELGKKDTVEAEEWDGEAGQEQFQKLQKAGRIMETLALQMQVEVDELDDKGDPVTYDEVDPITKQKVTKNKKVPLFTSEEIKDELYTPLVRSGLIPETNVPDEFSATKEMLDGTMGAYVKRLSSEAIKTKADENKSLAITMARGVFSLATQATFADADAGLSASDLQWSTSTSLAGNFSEYGTTYAVGQGMTLVGNVSDLVFDVGIEGHSGIQEKRARGEAAKGDPIKNNAGKVGGVAIAEIASSLSGALNHYGLGIPASAAFGAVLKGPAVAKKIEEKDVAGAADLIWTAFESTLIKIGPAADPGIAKAVAAAKAAFQGALKPADIIKSLEAGEFDKAASGLAAAGVAAATVIQNDNAVRVVFADPNQIAAAQAKAGQVVSAEFDRDDTPKPTPAQIKAHQPADKHKAEWVEGEEAFVCIKCPELKDDPDVLAGILERKIAQLEADQAIWKWITTLGGMGFDIASDFVAPLAVGGALVRMTKHAKEAHRRRLDMKNFMDEREAMISAASEFSTAVAQFVINAQKQFAHYTFNAAMEGLKACAAVLQVGVVTAPLAAGLSISASMAETAEGMLFEAKKRWDLDTAWNTYKNALENPDNRKAGLVAIKKNPTLAKYAVAWGALIKKDPLVGDFMRNCGLNKDTLKDPDANLDLVVSYLEKRMPDDNTVVGRDYSSAGKVELALSVWIKEKTLAENRLGMKPFDSKTFEFQLTQWEAEYPPLKDAKVRDPAAVTKCKTILQALYPALQNHKAFDKDRKPVLPFVEVKSRFQRRIKSHEDEIAKW